MRKLSDYAFNVHSEFGEDGIIDHIFMVLGTTSKICVEVGAWDGLYLSNTARLWKNGWEAFLIECDRVKYLCLLSNVKGSNCHCINARVTYDGNNTLENILFQNGLCGSIDLLSIDVDGDDYFIFQSLAEIRPRVIICEYNPTIPIDLDLVPEPGTYFGCSARSLVKLAESKGYRLVSITESNCLFVCQTEFYKFSELNTSLEALSITKHLTYLISGYDGEYIASRVPTYGCSRPSRHEFCGEYFLVPDPEPRSPFYLVASVCTLLTKQFIKAVGRGLSFFGLKEAVKRTSLYELYLHVRARAIIWSCIWSWQQRGRPVPPPHAFKEEMVRGYAKSFNLKTLVETGTYNGDMVYALRATFTQIFSIELDKGLHEKAKKKFAEVRNITLLQGDSSRVLDSVLQMLKEPCLFWLDAHYSGGTTTRGRLDTPIMQEVQHILKHHIKDHVILIDDARCFIGKHDYPTIDQLREVVQNNSIYVLYVRDDVIRIHRPAC